MAKKFFFVCAGILMLVLAYTLGANSIVAQSKEGNVVGIATYGADVFVVTAEGDVYKASESVDNWTHMANVFRVVDSE